MRCWMIDARRPGLLLTVGRRGASSGGGGNGAELISDAVGRALGSGWTSICCVCKGMWENWVLFALTFIACGVSRGPRLGGGGKEDLSKRDEPLPPEMEEGTASGSDWSRGGGGKCERCCCCCCWLNCCCCWRCCCCGSCGGGGTCC